MELRQLEYFVAVADEASFTRAAARVHVAQPGVSAQVRRLERELGQELLDRSGRAVRVTDAGAAVLPYARAALAAAAGARLAVDELAGLVRGHVTVGTVPSMSAHELDLPALLAAFHRDHPGVEITLSEAASDRLLDAVAAGRLDLAFAGLATAPVAAAPPPGVATYDVVREPFVAAVGHGDPLAGRTAVAIDALAGRALICLPRGTGGRASLDAACAAAGVRPRVAFEGGDPRVLAQLAASGLGVAILPASMVAARRDELHAVATRPGLAGRVVLAWRDDGPVSSAARALAGRVRHALEAGAGAGAAAIGPTA